MYFYLPSNPLPVRHSTNSPAARRTRRAVWADNNKSYFQPQAKAGVVNIRVIQICMYLTFISLQFIVLKLLTIINRGINCRNNGFTGSHQFLISYNQRRGKAQRLRGE